MRKVVNFVHLINGLVVARKFFFFLISSLLINAKSTLDYEITRIRECCSQLSSV